MLSAHKITKPEIKSFPFPVLSPHSIDYNDGTKYSAKIAGNPGAKAVRVRHNLVGDSLVSHLLREGMAAFACIVCVPSTMYRHIFVADSRAQDCQQEVDYSESGHGDDTDAVESPMFRPVILMKEPITQKAGKSAGLGELWTGNTVDFPNGAIIAFDYWARFGGEGGGLYDKLQSPERHARHRAGVFTCALKAAFHILKNEYRGKSNWREYINLRLVADKLEREGAGHWSDSKFSPELAAEILYPHIFEDVLECNDDDS